MLCPKCSGKQYCPCPACQDRHGQEIVWRWITHNGPIACGHCGHTMSEWDWGREEWKQHKEENDADSECKS